MRKAEAFVPLLLLVAATLVPSASAVAEVDSGGGTPVVLSTAPGISQAPITSDNVTYHGTIPIDSPGVGGEVVNHVNGNRYFYATGLKGLSIYDISDPEIPVLAGYLPFPHAQNEDLKVSADGTRTLIAADGALLVGIFPEPTRGLHVIDTSDPTAPAVLGRHPDSNHTAECADAACEWLYGSNGLIYDARNPAAIVVAGRWNLDRAGRTVGGRHALRRDESGIVISDSTPRLVLDPRVDPAHPVLLAEGWRAGAVDNRLQHNNVRPDAAQWVARDPNSPADYVQRVGVAAGPRSISATSVRPVMRPGELMIGNAESNLNNNCSSAGGLSTWSIVDFDKGAPMQQLEVFRPLNGTWLDGSPRVNALGCSGHWFTENGGIVAASWYEHGVHFFRIRKDIGTITEIGYFQPVATEAGAAYWVDDTHVYNVDYARGIDILSFDRGAAAARQKELDRAWMANLGRVGTFSAAERFACRGAILGKNRLRIR